MKNHFNRVLEYVRRTDQNYRALYSGNHTHPIPFFGNPESALVLTVGLNPSRDEFIESRGWPESIADSVLETRLLKYFSPDSQPQSHPFFNPWKMALALLMPDISYSSGTVAHLDLSPRATAFPRCHRGETPEARLWQDQFLKMLANDAHWFFEALKKCKKARLVLMAGTATDRFYLDQFISKYTPSNTCLKYDQRGNSDNVSSFHNLVGLGLNLPIFFSGAGPAFQGGVRLVDNVRANLDILNSKMCGTLSD